MRKTIFMLLGLFTLPLLFGCGYNTLKSKEVATSKAWNDLGFACRQRLELVVSYLEIVRKHEVKESKVLHDVETATHAAISAGCPITPPDTSQKLNRFREVQAELTKTLAHLQVVTGNYPELINDYSYITIQKRLEVVESHINEAITNYNSASHDFNTCKRTFPNSLTNALMLRYNDKEPFRASEKVKLVEGKDS